MTFDTGHQAAQAQLLFLLKLHLVHVCHARHMLDPAAGAAAAQCMCELICPSACRQVVCSWMCCLCLSASMTLVQHLT